MFRKFVLPCPRWPNQWQQLQQCILPLIIQPSSGTHKSQPEYVSYSPKSLTSRGNGAPFIYVTRVPASSTAAAPENMPTTPHSSHPRFISNGLFQSNPDCKMLQLHCTLNSSHKQIRHSMYMGTISNIYHNKKVREEEAYSSWYMNWPLLSLLWSPCCISQMCTKCYPQTMKKWIFQLMSINTDPNNLTAD